MLSIEQILPETTTGSEIRMDLITLIPVDLEMRIPADLETETLVALEMGTLVDLETEIQMEGLEIQTLEDSEILLRNNSQDTTMEVLDPVTLVALETVAGLIPVVVSDLVVHPEVVALEVVHPVVVEPDPVDSDKYS